MHCQILGDQAGLVLTAYAKAKFMAVYLCHEMLEGGQSLPSHAGYHPATDGPLFSGVVALEKWPKEGGGY